MPAIVINVRPSRQRIRHIIRVDKRNSDAALNNIGKRAILYAPADEPSHGYFGMATVSDIMPDLLHRRFVFIRLEDMETFRRCFALDELTRPLESSAYRADGTLDFSYFSMGVRTLSGNDRRAVHTLIAEASSRGMAENAVVWDDGTGRVANLGLRQTREFLIRSRRLRWAVIEAYGPACAVCGDNDCIEDRGAYEVQVAHLHALGLGGPDDITNAMPMCGKHHWAYDEGLFTLTDAGGILPSRHMTPQLRQRFNGWTRAHFPDFVEAWPRAEYLQFHRHHVFLR